MKYAIIGSGNIGTALARAFARQNIEVALANSRDPQTLADLAQEIGASVSPQSAQDAVNAEMIFLAVPFPAHADVARMRPDWSGKIVVDLTNDFGGDAPKMGGGLSSQVVARAFGGARLVKAFNHLAAQQLGTNAPVEGQAQTIFVSSDDATASASVAALATKLGFAPIELGPLAGGAALHVVDGNLGGLLLQNLAKIDD